MMIMPRGAKKSEEQLLESIDKEIAEMESRKTKIDITLKNLNEQRKEILQSIKTKKLAELAKVLDQTGKTPEDILEMLKSE